jgi:hypothetical protein
MNFPLCRLYFSSGERPCHPALSLHKVSPPLSIPFARATSEVFCTSQNRPGPPSGPAKGIDSGGDIHINETCTADCFIETKLNKRTRIHMTKSLALLDVPCQSASMWHSWLKAARTHWCTGHVFQSRLRRGCLGHTTNVVVRWSSGRRSTLAI